jgi:CubicO group peptidase (beta-lactamase class C family)
MTRFANASRRAACAVLLAPLALALSPTSSEAQRRTRDAVDPIDEFVANTLRSRMTPGTVVMLVHGDSVVFQRAYGRTALDASAPPLAEDAVFRAAAVTELVNALAATSLAAAGRVDLDAPLGTRVAGVPPELRAANLGQLLSHTAGMSRRVAVPGRGGADDLGAAARQLTRFDRMTDPGLLYSFSETGIALAGLAVQQAGGRPYAELVKELVFEPLGMTESTLAMPPASRLTPGWTPSTGSASPVDPVPARADSAAMMPVRGLYTTAADLARLAVALLNDGVVDGERRLPAGAVSALWQVRAPITASTTQAATGVRIGSWREHTSVTLQGSAGGHAALMQLLPDEGLAVIVLANNEGIGLAGVADMLLRQRLGIPDAPPQATQRTAAAEPDRSILAELAANAGEYENGSELLEIVVQNGRPLLRSDDLTLELRPLASGAANALLHGRQTDFTIRLIRDDRGRSYLWLGDRALASEAVRKPTP